MVKESKPPSKPTQKHRQKKEQIEVVNVVEFVAVKREEPEDKPGAQVL